mmetsp:Transcript_35307/g.100564  ORF Transcript_35307/g.100564 Transcript_35307/m.100564 type:complete len:260 (+) Transcript_35307:110-889(+)
MVSRCLKAARSGVAAFAARCDLLRFLGHQKLRPVTKSSVRAPATRRMQRALCHEARGCEASARGVRIETPAEPKRWHLSAGGRRLPDRSVHPMLQEATASNAFVDLHVDLVSIVIRIIGRGLWRELVSSAPLVPERIGHELLVLLGVRMGLQIILLVQSPSDHGVGAREGLQNLQGNRRPGTHVLKVIGIVSTADWMPMAVAEDLEEQRLAPQALLLSCPDCGVHAELRAGGLRHVHVLIAGPQSRWRAAWPRVRCRLR